MRRKSLSALAMIIVVCMVLAACNNQTTTTNTDSASQTSNETGNTIETENSSLSDTIDEEITMNIWTNNSSVEHLQNMTAFDLLQEKFPNVTFEYYSTNGSDSTVEELIMQGVSIDIYVESIGVIAEPVENDLQYDMTSLIKKHNVDLSSLNESAIEFVNTFSNGEFWVLPLYMDTMVLYYNKDLFDLFGVDYPKDGMTWMEAGELGKQMTRTADNQQYYGFTIEWIPHTFRMNQLSLPLVDPNTKQTTLSTDPKWADFVRTVYLNNLSGSEVASFVEEKGRLPNRSEFVNQTLAMMTGLASYATSIPELQQGAINWDMVSLPTFEDLPGVGPQPYPVYAGISSMSENKDAAMKVLKYLVSKEVQDQYPSLTSGIPVLVASQAAYTEDSNGKNRDAVFYNGFAPIAVKTKYDNLVENGMRGVIPKIISGEMDLNTALRTVAEEANLEIATREKQ